MPTVGIDPATFDIPSPSLYSIGYHDSICFKKFDANKSHFLSELLFRSHPHSLNLKWDHFTLTWTWKVLVFI